MEGFTELEVWQRGCRLCESIYSHFGRSSNFEFRDQLTRAALSIPSNIAEGYERGSRRDFIRFLRMAKGSSAELRAQLWIGGRVGLLDDDRLKTLVAETKEISRMLQGLIAWLKNQENDPQ